jgi:hypothetical protein
MGAPPSPRHFFAARVESREAHIAGTVKMFYGLSIAIRKGTLSREFAITKR